MKRLILIFVLLGVCLSAFPQDVQWIRNYKRFDRRENDKIYVAGSEILGMETGPFDDLITIGTFKNIVFQDSLYQSVWDPDPFWRNNRFENVYVANHRSDGFENWIKIFSAAADIQVKDMHSDNAGNIYIMLKSTEIVTYGDETLLQDADGNVGGLQLIKLDYSGNLVWTSDILIDTPLLEATARFEFEDMVVNDVGEVYGVILFRGTLDFGTGTVFNREGRFNDPLLIKWGIDGQVLWGNQAQGDWNETPFAFHLAIDEVGNVILGGGYAARITDTGVSFMGSSETLPPSTGGVYFAKFNPEGIPLWLSNFTPGEKRVTNATQTSLLEGLTTDGEDLLASIAFNDNLVVGLDTLECDIPGEPTTAIIKKNRDGRPLWTQSIFPSNGGTAQIEVNPATNQFIVMNRYYDPVTFDDSGTQLERDRYVGDFFFTQYTSNGTLLKVDTTEYIFNGGFENLVRYPQLTYTSDGSAVVAMRFTGRGSSFNINPDLVDQYGQVTIGQQTIDTAFSVMVKVDFNSVPDIPITVDLGPDISQCGGEVTLDAGVASSYLWSTGANTRTITTDSTGSFAVQVTSASGSTASDTILVRIDQPVDLPDTVLAVNSLRLESPVMAKNYLWSTGDTTRSITVDVAGFYTLSVTTTIGCESVDSTYVSLIPLSVYAGGSGSGYTTVEKSVSGAFYQGGNGAGYTLIASIDKTGVYGGGSSSGYSSDQQDGEGAFYAGGLASGYTSLNLLQNRAMFNGGLASGYSLTQIGNTTGFYHGGMGSGYASAEMIREILATIDQQDMEERVSIYPNPASEMIHFESKGDITYIEIYSAKGLRMIEQEVPDGKSVSQLPIHQLPNGVHLVIIHKKTGKVFYNKLIKQ